MVLISQNLHTHSHGKQWHRAHTLNLLFVAPRCVRNTSRLCETPRISRRSFVPLLWNLPIRYEALWSLGSRLRRCYPCPVWYCNGIADQYEFGLYYCADPLCEILPAGIGTLTMLTGRLHPCVPARTHAPPPRVVVDGGSGPAVEGKSLYLPTRLFSRRLLCVPVLSANTRRQWWYWWHTLGFSRFVRLVDLSIVFTI